MRRTIVTVGIMLALALVDSARSAGAHPGQQTSAGGTQQTGGTQTNPDAAAPSVPGAVTPPADYVIGPDDVLAVVYWREKELSADQVVVRPDGKITLPLLNDIQAAGLTPDELRKRIEDAATKFVQDPTASVVIKTINSRKVFITGLVNKPGTYPLSAPTTVLQLVAMAGGLNEFAKADKIVIMRSDGAQTKTFKFNYKDVLKGRNLQQNIELRPGDTVLVP